SLDQMRGDLAAADEKAQEAIRITEAGKLEGLVLWSHVFLAAHDDWRGNFAKAAVGPRRAEDVARPAGGGFMGVMAVAVRCKADSAGGEHTEGLRLIEEGLAKARGRDNRFFIGRLENTVGWVHQELGDFAGALEHDRLSADIGRQIKNGNVEISALINEGFDHLHLGDPSKTLALLEEPQRRATPPFA